MRRIGYIGLGSNLGDREANLRQAVDALQDQPEVEVSAWSSIYETAPQGAVLDQPNFLNAAVRIETDLDPVSLLEVCKRIESDLGRAPDAPRHSPRPVDLDLLLLGDAALVTDRLTLPHPELRTRHFVVAPLLELDPDAMLPDGERLDGLLAGVADQALRRISALLAS